MWSCTSLFQILRWGVRTEVLQKWRCSSGTHTLLVPISIQAPFPSCIPSSCIDLHISVYKCIKTVHMNIYSSKTKKNCIIRCQINIQFPCQGCCMTKPIKQPISVSNNGAQEILESSLPWWRRQRKEFLQLLRSLQDREKFRAKPNTE